MVLEGSTSSDSSFSDTFPSSDIDPYASDNASKGSSGSEFALVSPQPDGIYVDMSTLPRRWSIFGQRAHEAKLVGALRDTNAFAASVLQRPVKQEEADALALLLTKSVRMASYGTPVGTLFAGAMAYRSQKEMRFPGWAPFKEGSRFSRDSFGPLKGSVARAAWQVSRLSAWGLVGTMAGSIFFGSYALSVNLTGRAMDPRLKEFNDALKSRSQRGLGRENAGKVGNQEAGPKGMETYDMARQRRDAQGIGRSGFKRPGQTTDDASPTGGAFSEDHAEMIGSTGFLSEEEVRRAADARSESPRNQNARAYEQSSTASRQSTADSTSPKVGREVPASRQSGSTWDRLRNDAMTGEQKRSHRSAQPSGSDVSLGDSFSFSSSDEERQLAKSEAQRDFNARVEREREGKSFEEKGGGRDRW